MHDRVGYECTRQSSQECVAHDDEYLEEIGSIHGCCCSRYSECLFDATKGALVHPLYSFDCDSELCREGIAVQTESGVNVGRSKKAGFEAISQVAVSRVATAFPVVFLPGLIINQIEKIPWMAKSRPRMFAANLVTISASLLCALPCAVALYPQVATMKVDRLEDDVKAKAKELGVDTVYFNRGL